MDLYASNSLRWGSTVEIEEGIVCFIGAVYSLCDLAFALTGRNDDLALIYWRLLYADI